MKRNPYAFLVRLGEAGTQLFLVGLVALGVLAVVVLASTLPSVHDTAAVLMVAGGLLLATRLPGHVKPLFLLLVALVVMVAFRLRGLEEPGLPVILAQHIAYAAAPPLLLTLVLGDEGRERLRVGLLHVWAPAVALFAGTLVHTGLRAHGVDGIAEPLRTAAIVCAAVYGVLIGAALLWRVARRAEAEATTVAVMGKGARLEESGRFGAAALAYEREGQNEAAAEAAKRAGDWARAARIYQRLGQAFDAGEMFARAQLRPQALACYEEARAWPAAARLCAQMGDVERATQLLEKASDPAGVVRLLEEVGRTPSAEQYRRSGQPARAAEAFLAAGEWQRAADVLEHDLGDAERAARLHHEHGSFVLAGRLFESVGRLADAAQSFAAAPEGKLDAARLLVRAGDLTAAAALLASLPASRLEDVEDDTTAEVVARVMLETGRADGAARLLQGLKRRGAAGGTVHLLLGRAFLDRGLPELAEPELRVASQMPMAPEEEMQARYQLARTLESLGQADEARALYQELLQRDLTYADVHERYRRLKDAQAVR
jgi:tetratricopeptide (TPR) repeat protein